jgi:hypothetical protein
MTWNGKYDTPLRSLPDASKSKSFGGGGLMATGEYNIMLRNTVNVSRQVW